jgi:hypothetical protein
MKKKKNFKFRTLVSIELIKSIIHWEEKNTFYEKKKKKKKQRRDWGYNGDVTFHRGQAP